MQVRRRLWVRAQRQDKAIPVRRVLAAKAHRLPDILDVKNKFKQWSPTKCFLSKNHEPCQTKALATGRIMGEGPRTGMVLPTSGHSLDAGTGNAAAPHGPELLASIPIGERGLYLFWSDSPWASGLDVDFIEYYVQAERKALNEPNKKAFRPVYYNLYLDASGTWIAMPPPEYFMLEVF